MAVCSNGHENPDGLAFCRSCGALFIPQPDARATTRPASPAVGPGPADGSGGELGEADA